MTRLHRRAYVPMVAIAVGMVVWLMIVHWKYDQPLLDPEGAFLGPSWLRLPLLLAFGLALDFVPRVLWVSRLRVSRMGAVAKERWRSHWTRERLVLVGSGIICFYLVYVSYRDLKSAVPAVRTTSKGTPLTYDRELEMLDRLFFFGHDPAVVLHNVLGVGVSAYFLSYVYLWFLSLVPVTVAIWLLWSRNISFGYWFVTAQCIAWTLGTVSYYDLPTLGPGFENAAEFTSLPKTPATDLLNSLANSHLTYLHGQPDGSYLSTTINSVAGFASLHCAITLLMALMVQYTLRNVWLKRFFWVNFCCTVVATIYFGWHDIADDIAGVMIAIVSFYVGGLATGQRFNKFSLTSHPTTTTSLIPIDEDDDEHDPASSASRVMSD